MVYFFYCPLELSQEFAESFPCSYRLFCVFPVLEMGLTDSLDPLLGFRPSALSAMKPAPTVFHRRAQTWSPFPCLSFTPGSYREVAWRIVVFEPSPPLFTGFALTFCCHPPYPRIYPQNAPRRPSRPHRYGRAPR